MSTDKKGVDKANQSYGKDLTRISEYSTRITKSNKLRKHLICQYNKFIQKLLAEGRVTKEELAPFFPKKKVIEDKFDDQAPSIKYQD